jgi:hypothetical protein
MMVCLTDCPRRSRVGQVPHSSSSCASATAATGTSKARDAPSQALRLLRTPHHWHDARSTVHWQAASASQETAPTKQPRAAPPSLVCGPAPDQRTGTESLSQARIQVVTLQKPTFRAYRLGLGLEETVTESPSHGPTPSRIKIQVRARRRGPAPQHLPVARRRCSVVAPTHPRPRVAPLETEIPAPELHLLKRKLHDGSKTRDGDAQSHSVWS